MIDPDAAMSFFGFVDARHQAWCNRQVGNPPPWSDDPIVNEHKFTNVFRAIDYGSQFLIKELLNPEASRRDILMRCFLYRHTGRVEAWEYLDIVDGYPCTPDLDAVLDIWKEYRGKGFTKTQNRSDPNSGSTSFLAFERPMFTNAYLVFPQSQTPGTDKLEAIVDLTKRLFDPGSPTDIVPDFLAAETQAARYATLRRNKGVGDFMAMQILTDYGYSEQCGEDREDEFVVCGPGSTKGAKLLDPEAPVLQTLDWAMEILHESAWCPELPLDDYGEHYRKPSKMDVQNLFCEFSKYDRFASKPSPQKPYKPAHPGLASDLVLPAHW